MKNWLWALALAAGASGAGPAAAQSGFDDYANLRAIEILDNQCLDMRATDRQALAILIDDAYERAEVEASLYYDLDDFLDYMDFQDELEWEAELRVPPACDSDPLGRLQHAYVAAARLNFALFMLANHFDVLPETDPLHKRLDPARRDAMNAYVGVLEQMFGAQASALQAEAENLAGGIFANFAAGMVETWIESVAQAIVLEVAIEQAGYRARTIYYYGENKLALLDESDNIAALGVEWPQYSRSASGSQVLAWMAVTPDLDLRLYVFDPASTLAPPVPQLFLRTEALPEGLEAHNAFASPHWRRLTTRFGAIPLDAGTCVIGPCYAIDPGFLERFDGNQDRYELVFAASSAPDAAGAPNPANQRYTGPIRTAIEDIWPRYR